MGRLALRSRYNDEVLKEAIAYISGLTISNIKDRLSICSSYCYLLPFDSNDD